MKLKHITPILNVSDVAASLAWFEKLGWERSFTWNDGGMIQRAADWNEHGPANFGAAHNGHCEIFMCRDGQGSKGMPPHAIILEELQPGGAMEDRTPGVWMSWWLESPEAIDEAYEVCKRHGVFVACAPVDEPWGVREMRIMHPDGHTFRVSAGLKR